jgi:hypothetical protein
MPITRVVSQRSAIRLTVYGCMQHKQSGVGRRWFNNGIIKWSSQLVLFHSDKTT